MCGIVSILASSPVNQAIYDALTIIQHRGQDAAGIMTSDADRVYLRKANGLVRDVVREQHMIRLRGNMGIGHVRYPTAGTQSAAESQPFYVNSPYGLSLVHNGNLINAKELTHDLVTNDLRHLNTRSDSEVLLNVFAHELQRTGGIKLQPNDLFSALKVDYSRVQGAYSAIIMIHGYGILAFRDPYGIRPLVYGRRKMAHGVDYMMASESIALDALGYELIDDVGPGEAIFIDLQGNCHRQQCVEEVQHSPCLFEYIYLARADSVMEHISVYQARINMGYKLAEKILLENPHHDIDVVIPIPETSRTAALPLSQRLGVPYSEGFVKNRYIGRTFIMAEQSERVSSVRMKLNAIKSEFQGKNVLLVDDSIVRGTTSQKIIDMAREAGARRVYFASAAPPVRFPNVYGIDMPTKDELIAHNRGTEEIAKFIGADWLIYQDLADVHAAVKEAMLPSSPRAAIKQFEDSVFTGHYITNNVTEAYLKQLAILRSDGAKQKKSTKV
jgi:amidophosphoribosyltransferase